MNKEYDHLIITENVTLSNLRFFVYFPKHKFFSHSKTRKIDSLQILNICIQHIAKRVAVDESWSQNWPWPLTLFYPLQTWHCAVITTSKETSFAESGSQVWLFLRPENGYKNQSFIKFEHTQRERKLCITFMNIPPFNSMWMCSKGFWILCVWC